MMVMQEWTGGLSMMQQTVLLTAIRGPDGVPKYHRSKYLLRWFRRCILLSAIDGRVLTDPLDPSGGSFTGPSLDGEAVDCWEDRMLAHVNVYIQDLDAIPHHFQLHFLHACEILGYKHPDLAIRFFWCRLYERLVADLHLHCESEREMDGRLGDTRAGWLARADPATAA